MKTDIYGLKKSVSAFSCFIRYLIITVFVKLISLGKKSTAKVCRAPYDGETGLPLLTICGEIAGESDNFVSAAIETLISETESRCTAVFCETGLDRESEQMILSKGVINTAWYPDCIADLGNTRVGITFFGKTEKEASLYDILKRKEMLKRAGADFMIAYVQRSGGCTYHSFVQYTKKIARCGYECVVGLNSRVHTRRSLRTYNFSESTVFYSLGKITDRAGKNNSVRSAAAVRLGFDPDRKRVAQQGYFATAVCHGQFLICRRNGFLSEGDRLFVLNELKDKMRGLHEWNEQIFLRDVAAAAGVTLPERFSYLENYTVNSICSRSSELAPGNVFFYRQQFQDKNDSRPVNEVVRMKLILRAVMRKTLFIFSCRRLLPWIPHMVVEDAIEAHVAAIGWYRKRLPVKCIGITGSVGKTSTKDMMYHVLCQSFKTEKSRKNSNVQTKIGINVQRIREGTGFFIQEIGGGRPGGASRHSRMIAPAVSVVTNIGTAHIGNYESQLELMANKLQITEGMEPDGCLFLNGDDPLLASVKTDCRTCYFAVNNRNADYYADRIRENGHRTSFDIVYGSGQRYPVELNVPGTYNILNAVCSFAVGKYLGMRGADIAKGLLQFKTEGTRQNLVNVGGYHLFVDCFNASADSVESALSVLVKLNPGSDGGKKAVIGDITGMGEQAEEINRQVGDILSSYLNRLDELVLYGDNSREIMKNITGDKSKIRICRSPAEMNTWIRSSLKREDVTLFKGSSKVKLDERIDDIFGTNFSDGKYVEGLHYIGRKQDGIRYRIFEEYATAWGAAGISSQLKIKNRLGGKKVKKIRMSAFRGSKILRRIKLGRYVLHIGTESFAQCGNLETAEGGDRIVFIGRKAFENCVSLKKIRLPETLRFMGAGAFANCRKLKTVRIPGNCINVSKGAFSGCSGLGELLLEEGVQYLSENCFSGCTGLTEVRIPDSVIEVQAFAFRGCTGLQTVYAGSETIFDKNAFADCPNVRILKNHS